MLKIPLSTNAHQIGVTITATPLSTLLLTADSTTTIPADCDAIELQAEGGDIRYSVCGTPSATKGMLLRQYETRIIRGVKPADVILISASGTITTNVQLGYTNRD